MMRPNFFIALPVEGDLRGVRDAPPSARLLSPQDRHLTLAFLGPCDPDDARRAFEGATFAQAPFEARLGPALLMGPPGRGTALAALVADPGEALLMALTTGGAAMLEAASLPPDPRPPRPHVTLARIRRRASSAERQAAIAWAQGLRLGGSRVRFSRLALYTWSADRTARLFRIVGERPLPARPSPSGCDGWKAGRRKRPRSAETGD